MFYPLYAVSKIKCQSSVAKIAERNFSSASIGMLRTIQYLRYAMLEFLQVGIVECAVA